MAKKQKLELCRNCSSTMPKGSKKCPACGAKNKKPFYKRWWFVLLAIIVLIGAIGSLGGSGEKIKWSEMELGHLLPEPPVNKGKLYENSDEQLWVTYDDVSDAEYNDFLDECKDMGFDIDADKTSSSYKAYNEDGYSLEISHYSDKLSINLEAPMELGTFTWPTGTAGSQIPAPKSTVGKFSFEYDDNFFLYVGDTSRSDYDEYVNSCSDAGFNVDYSKGDNYYYADNAEGWHISLRYEGNNIMSIDIDAPDEEEPDDTSATEENAGSGNTTEPIEKEPTEESPEDTSSELVDGMRPEFKEAMDAYEEFMNEYCEFMEKYAASDGTDLGLLADYATYMSKYAEAMEAFEKWDGEDLNAAETAYYIEVQTRINKKLLAVAS